MYNTSLQVGRLLWVAVCFSMSCRLVGGFSAASTSKKGTFNISSKSPSSKKLAFHVAPMQCYTNLALRHLLHRLSPSSILWTEMEKVTDLLQTDTSGLERRFGNPGHKDIVLQIGGNDPVLLRACLRHLAHHGYTFSEINLNCGCPSIESGGAATFGASLMKQPELTRELISSLTDTVDPECTKVSLKCRIAVLDTIEDLEENLDSESMYQDLYDFIEEAQAGGLSHVILHARGVVLSGLSPVKNRQVPPLDYTVVERIARDFSMPVTLNGGLHGLSHYRDIVHGLQDSDVAGIMSGRWILRRPLDLAVVEAGFQANTGVESYLEPASRTRHALEDYSKYVQHCVQSSRGKDPRLPTLGDLCLPLFLVADQLKADYEEPTSDLWLSDADLEDLYDVLCETVSSVEESLGKKTTKFRSNSIQFNKLNSSFKSLVGTKVANKWKRNRAEL